MNKLFFTLLIFLFATQISFAQTKYENSGWLMFVNNTKLNEKWGVAVDVQFRSADNMDKLKHLMVRPGLTYFINKNNNVTVGYLLNQTYIPGNFISVGGAGDFKNTLNEHRIWQQYVLTHKISSVFATQRLRLEQRFIERNGGKDFFAQRFRYFFRLIQPLQKKQDTFSKGAFVALQNEVFLNIQNKDEINNSLFDQNRVYLATGYRFSPKVDVEVGYLNQASHGAVNNVINNVVQLALYTRF